MPNDFLLSKKRMLLEESGYSLFYRISKSYQGKLIFEFVYSNQKIEYISIINLKISFEYSSFMMPLDSNLFFIVCPLNPCKVELYTSNDKYKLEGVHYKLSYENLMLMKTKDQTNETPETYEKILLYIPQDDDPNVFLGIEYYFNSPFQKYMTKFKYKHLIMNQINQRIHCLKGTKTHFNSSC
jgi:hypothetical protein